jgi:hypothetical protein
MKNKNEERFCSRKGAFCFEYDTCTSGGCSRNLPDFTMAVSVEPTIVDVDEPVLMGTAVIADDGGFTNYYTQAYVDELKQERDEYKELYETMYRNYSELATKDLNKKYAEAIAKDYLNKNLGLLDTIDKQVEENKELKNKIGELALRVCQQADELDTKDRHIARLLRYDEARDIRLHTRLTDEAYKKGEADTALRIFNHIYALIKDSVASPEAVLDWIEETFKI